MRTAALAVVAALTLTACDAGSSTETAPGPEPPHSAAPGNLSAEEFARAVEAGKRVQSTIQGTFVGATATAVDKPQLHGLDQGCPDERLIHVRLVWMADANFDHAGTPGGPPDGPRKAALVTIDAGTGDVCAQGAAYRHVGARPDEVLLYGSRP